MSLVSIATTLLRASEKLQLAGSETPQLDAQVLLRHVLRCERSYLFTWPERLVLEPQASEFQTLLAMRLAGHPIAHIIGQREFWSLPLAVNNSTLIPRPDTELLVATVLNLALPTTAAVLELGTGTGAIALALASERRQWQISAVDCVPAAVALAQQNQTALKLKNVDVFLSSWFSAVAGRKFHLIVSNPPYIDAADVHLNQGDVRFEPRTALVADEAGLADLRHIIAHATNYLLPSGWLWLEHGYQQGAAVRELFAEYGYTAIQTCCDYADHERITGAQRT